MGSTQSDRRTQTTPQTPLPTSDAGIPVILLDDDSEETTEEEVAAPTPRAPCDYDPCRHLQTPCAELQRRSRCGCPGLSREDTVPDPPRLRGLSEVTDTSVLVAWCAPYSVVRAYQIRYSAEGGAGNQSVLGDIYATARQHPLYGLSPGTTYRVCVVAANAAGLSQPRAVGPKRPCATVTTKPSSAGVLAALGTACGLLLLGTLALTACLCRRGRKPCGPDDTHLVAFQNPYLLPFESPGRDCRRSAAGGLFPAVREAPGSVPRAEQRQKPPAFACAPKLQTFG